MNTRRRNILSILDNALRWTGIPARVADEMSDAPSVDRKHRPLRWIPIWPIAFSCALFILSLTWRSALNLMALVPSLGVVIVAMVPVIHMNGPLGKPSLEAERVNGCETHLFTSLTSKWVWRSVWWFPFWVD
jgi:hypothetical protein